MIVNIVLIIAIIGTANAKCVNCHGTCLPSPVPSRRIIQVNNATGFYPFYVDSTTSYFADGQCQSETYQILNHLSYDNSYCVGTIESVWIKIINKKDEQMKAILDSCGSKLKKKFVDISHLDCQVNGKDPFESYRKAIGTQQYNYKGVPDITGTTCDASCSKKYNVGDSWMNGIFIWLLIGLLILAVIVIVVIQLVIKQAYQPVKVILPPSSV